MQTKKKPIKKPRKSEVNFSVSIAEKICYLTSVTPHGLADICKKNPGLPAERTIRGWAAADKKYMMGEESFAERYLKARRLQGHVLIDECLRVAQDTTHDFIRDDAGYLMCDKFGIPLPNPTNIQRSRLQNDTYKFIAMKLLPRMYGELITIEDLIDQNAELRGEVIELRVKLDAQHRRDY